MRSDGLAASPGQGGRCVRNIQRPLLRQHGQLDRSSRPIPDAAASLLRGPRVLRVREGRHLRTGMALRGSPGVGGQARRLLHRHAHGRAAGGGQRQGRRGARHVHRLPAPRHAGGRRQGQHQGLPLPLPPLVLRPGRTLDRRPRHGAGERLRMARYSPAAVQGRGLAGLHLHQLRSPGRASGPAPGQAHPSSRAVRPDLRRLLAELRGVHLPLELEGDVREQ